MVITAFNIVAQEGKIKIILIAIAAVINQSGIEV
jgi:hypothetical protein